MTLLVTEAIVLHVLDYLESSRIVRLATRDAGVQSVIAKGARRPRNRFGAALDLFAQGSAQFTMRPGRDLHTLTGFDLARSRTALAADLARFTGAAALAELTLRFAHEDASPEVFDALADALDDLVVAPPDRAREVAIGGAWRLVAALGFAPSLDACAICHRPAGGGDAVLFHHRAGGVLCERCAGGHAGGRAIPGTALAALRDWLSGGQGAPLDARAARAHQRLLQEFVREHLADARPLRAFESWARGALEEAAP
ncbi:MAG TPA: DNA repair protein RecO [Gemmatimonadaceae bacterium]|nr:DNA repair protein RecO [Gemmatimonadaceae bacterium]